MSATLTVTVASQLGMPISTTHVAVGAVLGMGFLREVLKARHAAILAEIRANHPQGDTAAAEAFITRFHATSFGARKAMLADLKSRNKMGAPALLDKADRKALTRAHKRDIVNRSLIPRLCGLGHHRSCDGRAVGVGVLHPAWHAHALTVTCKTDVGGGR